MRKRMWVLAVALVCTYVVSGSRTGAPAAQTPPASAARKQLLVIFDGLRPDYVTPAVMPNLYAFGQRGIVFTNHHSVFPTVTRVNTSSVSTGSYPERHGLLGNTVFFPQVDPTKFLDTSNRAQMVRVDAATNGNLLMATTMGEALQATGRKLLVVSAGQTTREASRLAVQRLAGSGSKLLGVVMQKARSVDVPYYATYYKRR